MHPSNIDPFDKFCNIFAKYLLCFVVIGRIFLTCSSTEMCSFNEKLCNSKIYDLVAQGCKKVNSSKNDRFRYEMIAETQPEMELLEVVAFIYQNDKSLIPSSHRTHTYACYDPLS